MSSKTLHLIPDWQGDETLYSWSARMHRLLGGATKETGQRLFDSLHAYKEWSVCSRLDHLCSVTNGLLGDVRSILLSRTVLATYYPFLRWEQREAFDRRTRNPERTAWLTLFGMRASRMDRQELRWCPHCVCDDKHKWEITRWRLVHQLPGSWWCTEHEAPLQRLRPGRAEWALPESSDLVTIVTGLNDAEGQSLSLLSSLSASLVGVEYINLDFVKRALLSRLYDLGVIAPMKPVSAQALQHWFESTPLSNALNTAEPDMRSVMNREWVYETLLKRRANHPLLWMLLWTAAFEGEVTSTLIKGFADPESTMVWSKNGQGILWAEPVFEGGEKIQAIVRNAASVHEAAQQLNVSVTTVRRYMRETLCSPKQVREDDRIKLRQESAIAEIENLIRTKSTVTKSDVHMHCKAAVSWLKRWAPEILTELLARIPDVRDRQIALEFS